MKDQFIRPIGVCVLTAMLLAATSASVFGQQWTRFRGPNGSGISDAKTVPVDFDEGDFNWKTKLPGAGHSSPVIWGDKIFLTSADESAGKRYLICLATGDGSILWTRDFEFTKHSKHKQNTYATCTPTVDDHHVYAMWQSPQKSNLVALDHDGNFAWEFDLGDFKAGHGSAVSPITFEGMVIVTNDHQGKSPFLAALDGKSGELKWKHSRESMRPCYSTPCVYQPEGRAAELVFTHSYQGITSLDPRNGNLNWKILPFGEFQQRACASPIVAGDLVIGTSGFATAEKNVVAVRPDYSGSEPTVAEIYRISKSTPHVPTPLVYENRMYLWTDRGIVTCVDVSDGKRIWTARADGNYFGSPVCIDGKLYAMDVDGNVVIVATGDEFKLLNRVPLNETSCATPAVAGGVLYLRTLSHLISVGG